MLSVRCKAQSAAASHSLAALLIRLAPCALSHLSLQLKFLGAWLDLNAMRENLKDMRDAVNDDMCDLELLLGLRHAATSAAAAAKPHAVERPDDANE